MIAVRIDKVDFTTPRLIQNCDSEFMSDHVNVINPQVDEGVRAAVPGMFREEKARPTASSN